MHSFETQTEDLATQGLKELFENIQNESIIEADLITHVDDHCMEEIPEDIESFMDEMLNSDRREEVHPYDAMLDYDDLEKTIPDDVEGTLNVDGRETIYAIGDRKPQRNGTADTDWQKIRITLDSGSTVDAVSNDELCQVEATPCTGAEPIEPCSWQMTRR